MLNLSWCRNIEDAVLVGIASACPALEHCDITRCTKITNEAVTKLAEKCGNLRQLNLTGTVSFSFSSSSPLPLFPIHFSIPSSLSPPSSIVSLFIIYFIFIYLFLLIYFHRLQRRHARLSSDAREDRKNDPALKMEIYLFVLIYIKKYKNKKTGSFKKKRNCLF